MFVPDLNTLGSVESYLGSFIENGFDLHNSKLLKYIAELPTEGVYQVTKYPHRIDLISLDIYNNKGYSDLLLLYNNKNINQLKMGVIIKYFSLASLELLIKSLDELP